jgi:lysozyme
MPSSTFVLEGIDVSSNQGPVDWQAVTAGTFLFAYLRATIGAHTADSQFAGNWVRIRRTKLLRGAYHYFWPLADPAEQANNYIQMVGILAAGDLPPALDIEEAYLQVNPGQDVWMTIAPDKRLPIVLNWLARVEHAMGVTPIIYSRENYLEQLLGNGVVELSGYPLWIARYTDAQQPSIPSAWNNWTFWQYSETGSVSGVSGGVDLDRFNGDLTSLKTLAKA